MGRCPKVQGRTKKDGLSSDPMAHATLQVGRNDEAIKHRAAYVGKVAVTFEGSQVATGKVRLPEPEEKIREAFQTREPSIFTDVPRATSTSRE